MTKILTDEEIFKLQYELQYREGGFHPIPFARAIEQAILNKLSEQEPVGYRYLAVDGSWRFDVMGKGDISEAVYEHPPAPSVSEVEAKYSELLMAVARKFPSETRHETALKYIKQMEEPSKSAAQLAAARGE